MYFSNIVPMLLLTLYLITTVVLFLEKTLK